MVTINKIGSHFQITNQPQTDLTNPSHLKWQAASSISKGNQFDCSFFGILAHVFSAIYRILTYPFQFLFIRAPKVPEFLIPDLTDADKLRYHALHDQIFPEPPPEKGWFFSKKAAAPSLPSPSQTIQLFHQFHSFLNHLEALDQINSTRAVIGTIGISPTEAGDQSICVTPKDPNFKEFAIKKFVELLPKAIRFKNDKDCVIQFSFDIMCTTDLGIGPHRITISKLITKNRLDKEHGITVTNIMRKYLHSPRF